MFQGRGVRAHALMPDLDAYDTLIVEMAQQLKIGVGDEYAGGDILSSPLPDAVCPTQILYTYGARLCRWHLRQASPEGKPMASKPPIETEAKEPVSDFGHKKAPLCAGNCVERGFCETSIRITRD